MESQTPRLAILFVSDFAESMASLPSFRAKPALMSVVVGFDDSCWNATTVINVMVVFSGPLANLFEIGSSSPNVKGAHLEADSELVRDKRGTLAFRVERLEGELRFVSQVSGKQPPLETWRWQDLGSST